VVKSKTANPEDSIQIWMHVKSIELIGSSHFYFLHKL
jgi:hypothetical protein